MHWIPLAFWNFREVKPVCCIKERSKKMPNDVCTSSLNSLMLKAKKLREHHIKQQPKPKPTTMIGNRQVVNSVYHFWLSHPDTQKFNSSFYVMQTLFYKACSIIRLRSANVSSLLNKIKENKFPPVRLSSSKTESFDTHCKESC